MYPQEDMDGLFPLFCNLRLHITSGGDLSRKEKASSKDSGDDQMTFLDSTSEVSSSLIVQPMLFLLLRDGHREQLHIISYIGYHLDCIIYLSWHPIFQLMGFYLMTNFGHL